MTEHVPLGGNARLKVIGQEEPTDEPKTMRFLDLLPEAQPAASFGFFGGFAEGAVRPLLERVREALAVARAGEDAQIFHLDHLSADEKKNLDDLLGAGEVRGVAQVRLRHEMQETIVPGVWKVETFDAEGRARGVHLEVGDVPLAVRVAIREATSRELPAPAEPPPGLMNGLPLLTELAHEMDKPKRKTNHVISFTLLPMNGADMKLLESTLGPGPVALESRGYGTCVVKATGRTGVWSVQHLNAMGEVVLDTLEVGDVPDGVVAAQEDFEDSILRIGELLEEDPS
jgi:hydrogenase-1 operon protein HyaF